MRRNALFTAKNRHRIFVGQLVLCLVGGIAAQHGKIESTGLIKGSLRPIVAQLPARPGVLGPSLGVADC